MCGSVHILAEICLTQVGRYETTISNINPNGTYTVLYYLSLSQIIGHRFVFFTRYFLSLLDDLFYAARPRLFNCCLNFKGLIQPNAACLRCLL